VFGGRNVTFFIDGKQVRTDSTVDYDLVGSGWNGTATPCDTSKLRNGVHVIIAKVDLLGEGVEVVYRASFTVRN
jgi:hypothetical protein